MSRMMASGRAATSVAALASWSSPIRLTLPMTKTSFRSRRQPPRQEQMSSRSEQRTNRTHLHLVRSTLPKA